MQPQSSRRQTRAAFDKVKQEREKNTKPAYTMPAKKPKVEVQVTSPSICQTTRITRQGSRSCLNPHAAKIESLQRQIEDLEERPLKIFTSVAVQVSQFVLVVLLLPASRPRSAYFDPRPMV